MKREEGGREGGKEARAAGVGAGSVLMCTYHTSTDDKGEGLK